MSREAGRQQVYVRAYPGPGPAIGVSGDNGDCPSWSPDGRELYFLAERGGAQPDAMMVVDIEAAEPFRASRARPLIEAWPALCNSPTRDYDVLPDGSFVAPVSAEGTGDRDPTEAELRQLRAVSELHVILNFAQELRRRVGS